MPTSAAVARWLRRWDGVLQLLVDPAHGWKDAVPSASRLVRAEPSGFVGAVAREMDRERREEGGGGDGAGAAGPTAWERRWRQVGSVARTLAREAHAEAPFEGTILADVVAALPAGAPLFVSSSMPVRDLDAFGEPRADELHVVGNRGASGIDGVVSTALGVAAASGRPAVCVLGDLAFFHDANGLLATREEGVAAVFIVVQNDGGGIFHMLPVADHEPAFTPYFATPHGLDFRHLADLHGLVHRPLPWEGPEDRETLEEALDDSLRRAAEEDRSTVLEVHTDRRETHRRLRELRARVEGAALDALRGRSPESEGP
jgi:2-succinyl-5-enolpyruvyl-6-hydroxy-3-cyclohexene-1-carboxylate synthase